MAFRTEQSVRIIVDGCISGVSARQGYTVCTVCLGIIYDYKHRAHYCRNGKYLDGVNTVYSDKNKNYENWKFCMNHGLTTQ